MKSKRQMIEELRASVDRSGLQKHVAIIMDGNGRWAQQRGLPRISGHKRGADSVRRVTEQCRQLGIPVLTLYAFSDENWGRPREEVGFLMDMLGSYLKAEIAAMKVNGIKFRTIGRVERLPSSALNWIKRAVSETAENTGLVLNLALSYGGRPPIINRPRPPSLRAATGNPPPQAINEETFHSHMSTHALPPVDLLIPTRGQRRRDSRLGVLGRYPDGEVDRAAAVRTGRVHALEPESRPAAARVDEVLVGAVQAGRLAQDGPPEGHHLGGPGRTDDGEETLDRGWVRRGAERPRHRGDPTGQLDVAAGHPRVVLGQREEPYRHAAGSDVHVRAVVLDAGQLADRPDESRARGERPGAEEGARAVAEHTPVTDALGLVELSRADLVAHDRTLHHLRSASPSLTDATDRTWAQVSQGGVVPPRRTVPP